MSSPPPSDDPLLFFTLDVYDVYACVRPLNNDLKRFTQIEYAILGVVMFMLLINLQEYYRLNCVNMNVYINDIVNIKISEHGGTLRA